MNPECTEPAETYKLAKDANATLAMYTGAVEVRRSGSTSSPCAVRSAVEHADYNDAATVDNRAFVQ